MCSTGLQDQLPKINYFFIRAIYFLTTTFWKHWQKYIYKSLTLNIESCFQILPNFYFHRCLRYFDKCPFMFDAWQKKSTLAFFESFWLLSRQIIRKLPVHSTVRCDGPRLHLEAHQEGHCCSFCTKIIQ